jgi:LPS O-antigen subunit length determinant protein (WzzB/FepE family)
MLEERTDTVHDIARSQSAPFSEPPKLDQLVGNVRILEDWYCTTFRRRIAEVTELLSSQISEELRAQFELQCKSQKESAGSQQESNIESLKKEIEQLRSGSRLNDGLGEVARIEKQINDIETELEHSFTTDSVPLSRLLQLRTTQTDLKSYLRGLKFFIAKSATETNLEEEPSLQS